jgi:hypothetical protein
MEVRQESTAPSRKFGGLSPWFSLLGGGVAWTFHIMSCYVIAEFGCLLPARNYFLLGITGVAWMLIAASLASIAMAGAAAYVAWRGEQATPDIIPGQTDQAHPDQYIVRVGIIMNLIFIFIIVAQSVPILFFYRVC